MNIAKSVEETLEIHLKVVVMDVMLACNLIKSCVDIDLDVVGRARVQIDELVWMYW